MVSKRRTAPPCRILDVTVYSFRTNKLITIIIARAYMNRVWSGYKLHTHLSSRLYPGGGGGVYRPLTTCTEQYRILKILFNDLWRICKSVSLHVVNEISSWLRWAIDCRVLGKSDRITVSINLCKSLSRHYADSVYRMRCKCHRAQPTGIHKGFM